MVFYNLPHKAGKVALMFFLLSLFRTMETKAQPTGPAAVDPGSRILSPGSMTAPRNAAGQYQASEWPDNLTSLSGPDARSGAGSPAQPPVTALRRIPDSVMQAMQNRREFAYANDPAYWEKKIRNDGGMGLAGSPWMKLLVYTLLTVALLFAFYRIIVANKLHLFYRSSSRKPAGETELMNIADDRLDEKIDQSIQAGDYRPAIRFLYLKALKMLDAKGWIAFNARSTNLDYVTELNKRPEGTEFRFITRNYEYVWYGEFAVNKPGFEMLYQRFKQFYDTLQSPANKELH